MYWSLGCRFTDALRRGMAVACAGLVLVLTILAACPGVHHRLHEDDAQIAVEDTCAVVLFANGVAQPVGPLALTPPVPVPQTHARCVATEIFLVSPRFLRQPERGPPTSWVG